MATLEIDLSPAAESLLTQRERLRVLAAFDGTVEVDAGALAQLMDSAEALQAFAAARLDELEAAEARGRARLATARGYFFAGAASFALAAAIWWLA